jgi:hypothetical protein
VKARIVLDGDPDGSQPIVCEFDGVETASGEKLEIAGLTSAAHLVAKHHLGRAPEGYPAFVYTATPIGG